MPKNEPLKRYFYEIEYIRKGDRPNLDAIRFYLENREVYVSARTIERDIEQIRNNFGIEVVYDPSYKGYYIDEEFSPNLPGFLRFLEIANTANLFIKGIKQTRDFIKNIDFDLRGGLQGTGNLRLLLTAINEQKKIRFLHYSYQTDNETNVTLSPYFLKEYLGRWYVVGMRDDKALRTYGIDRIKDLEITRKRFKKSQIEKARENFDTIIGLVYSYGRQERVVLSFTPIQGRYIKSFPWHHSQKIIIDDANELRISLFVVPNLELIRQILMNGPEVKVLEPQWLADEIKEKLKQSLGQYNK